MFLGILSHRLLHISSPMVLHILLPMLLRMILHLLFSVDSFGLEPVVLTAEQPEVRRGVVPAPAKGHDVVHLQVPRRCAPPAAGRDIAAPPLVPHMDLVSDLLRDITRVFFSARFRLLRRS